MNEQYRKYDTFAFPTKTGTEESTNKDKIRNQSPQIVLDRYLYKKATDSNQLKVVSKNDTVNPEELENPIPPFSIKWSPQIDNCFITLNKWEGCIVQVKKHSFIARLIDLTNKNNSEEEAEFPKDDIPESDKKNIVPGAIFYWHIGYINDIKGTKTRGSRIIFRTLPVWRKEEIEEARLKTENFLKKINDNKDVQQTSR